MASSCSHNLRPSGEGAQVPGKYKRCLPLFPAATGVAEASFGPIHPEVALRACILGDLLYDLESFSEARSQYRRALAIMEALSGEDHMDVAIILKSLGNTAKHRARMQRHVPSL